MVLSLIWENDTWPVDNWSVVVECTAHVYYTLPHRNPPSSGLVLDTTHRAVPRRQLSFLSLTSKFCTDCNWELYEISWSRLPRRHLDVMLVLLEWDRGGRVEAVSIPQFSVTSGEVVLNQWGLNPPPLTNRTLLQMPSVINLSHNITIYEYNKTHVGRHTSRE